MINLIIVFLYQLERKRGLVPGRKESGNTRKKTALASRLERGLGQLPHTDTLPSYSPDNMPAARQPLIMYLEQK